MTLENITHIPGPTLRGKLSDTFVRTTKGGVTTTKLTFIVEGSLGTVEETELIEIAKHGALCTVNGFKYEKPKPASAELTPAAAGNAPSPSPEPRLADGETYSDPAGAPLADKNDPKNIPASDLQKAVDALDASGKTDVAPAFQKALDQAAAATVKQAITLSPGDKLNGINIIAPTNASPRFQCPEHPTALPTFSYPAACITCGQRLEDEPGVAVKFDAATPPSCPDHPDAVPWRASRAKPWRCGNTKCKRRLSGKEAKSPAGAAK